MLLSHLADSQCQHSTSACNVDKLISIVDHVSYRCSLTSSPPYQDDAAAARALLVEMMADLDEEVAELFLMEEEVLSLAAVVNDLDSILKLFGMAKLPW